MVWSPDWSSDSDVEDYLIKVNGVLQDKEGLPSGSVYRDNEQALRILQSCDHDMSKAERMFNQTVFQGTLVVGVVY